MKHPEIIVEIPKPCHENWNKMSPAEKGKFCKVCTTEVVDFSINSDEEIINYFTKNNNVCGRFHASQLGRKLIVHRKKRNHWLSYAASFLLPMTLFSQETKPSQQKTPKTTQVITPTFKSLDISSLKRKINTQIHSDTLTVKGVIIADDGLPLPGASVYVKRTHKGTTANFDGEYEIEAMKGDELVFSYVGYTSKTIKVKDIQLNVTLEDMGGLMMIGAVVVSEKSNNGYVSSYARKTYPKPMTEEEVKARNQRTRNYFAFQRKKWLEKRAKRRLDRAERKSKKK